MRAHGPLVRELRRIAASRPPATPEPPEHCDLCGVEIPADHRHLVHLEERRIACSCETCRALLTGDTQWRPTGTRTLWLPDLDLPDDLWARFRIPIGLAFFIETSDEPGARALYPSPAGATESELELEAWEELVAANPGLADLEPDVEALLVDRLAQPHRHAIAPIDECYRLVGLIRTAWRGISGGPGVGEAVGGFFDEVRTKALA